jgi:anti-sigma B factor antagonist
MPVGGREPPIRRNPPLTVATEQCGRTLVLLVDGDIDLHTAPAVRQALESALSKRPRRLVVDLSLVQFLNSAGLEVLLAAHRQAAPRTDLRVVATTRATWRPIQITRLHEQLAIHTSRAEAIAAPARRGNEDRSPPVETHQSLPSLESAPS